jgi:hypothetical protein
MAKTNVQGDEKNTPPAGSLPPVTQGAEDGDYEVSPGVNMPPSRPLKVYAFDPATGRKLGNYMTINVDYEELAAGPIGKYLAVIDYDASSSRKAAAAKQQYQQQPQQQECYYQPVDLDDPLILVRGGLDPSESDPRFHQQMVYAVASETIRRFKFALGRDITWSFDRFADENKSYDDKHQRLRLFPHAMEEANAYYDRNLRAILFGYFPASIDDAGVNMPGQTVFTCLSHDIIVHETTHALIDSQRDFFTEPTSVDAPAFHEAFADIVALFQHFSFKEALVEMIQRTGGQIYRATVGPESQPAESGPTIQTELTTENPMVGLAKQFGDAMGMRKALRAALGTPPNSNDLQNFTEPHTRGSILVAAVFDAFFSIYVRRTREIMRVARAVGMTIASDDLHPDLANILAGEAAKTAEHFSNICIRALDYCPPVDIRFGDFLRALITADYDLVSDDKYGYRMALIEAFRSRGIYPQDVNSFSEESLLWCPPEVINERELPPCKGLAFDVYKFTDKGEPDTQRERNGAILHSYGDRNRKLLGLSGDPQEKVQARTFHHVHRIGPDGKLRFNVVAELTQHRQVYFDPAHKELGTFKFVGGTTLILERDGRVRYSIHKSLGDPGDDEQNERLQEQRDYQTLRLSSMAMASYSSENLRKRLPNSFSMIHRGY